MNANDKAVRQARITRMVLDATNGFIEGAKQAGGLHGAIAERAAEVLVEVRSAAPLIARIAVELADVFKRDELTVAGPSTLDYADGFWSDAFLASLAAGLAPADAAERATVAVQLFIAQRTASARARLATEIPPPSSAEEALRIIDGPPTVDGLRCVHCDVELDTSRPVTRNKRGWTYCSQACLECQRDCDEYVDACSNICGKRTVQ